MRGGGRERVEGLIVGTGGRGRRWGEGHKVLFPISPSNKINYPPDVQ